MSAATSSSTGRRYGVVRVCSAWGLPRSSFYLERRWRRSVGAATPEAAVVTATELPRTPTNPEPAVASEMPLPELPARVLSPPAANEATTEPQDVGPPATVTPPLATPRRRGPKPKLSDDYVLDLVRADLATSPFQAEGHRKVCARLRRGGHAVFARQVLRVMHAAQLLSPHRAPQGQPCVHDGTITTSEPDVMWGTDGMRVETVDDGWVWIFVAVEHWNAEVMGWHVTKRGDRFAALEPLKQGLLSLGRGVGKNAGTGLSVRMDHGTQYTADDFRNEVNHWGMKLSYGYVKEPQTNGVVERFNRTLKEQVVRGRVWRNVEELRAAVGAFVEAYNEQWLVAKNGYQSPKERRRQAAERLAA
jgi:putative transposase